MEISIKDIGNLSKSEQKILEKLLSKGKAKKKSKKTAKKEKKVPEEYILKVVVRCSLCNSTFEEAYLMQHNRKKQNFLSAACLTDDQLSLRVETREEVKNICHCCKPTLLQKSKEELVSFLMYKQKGCSQCNTTFNKDKAYRIGG